MEVGHDVRKDLVALDDGCVNAVVVGASGDGVSRQHC